MRVCFVGKYPPIQGGVSAQTYWAVRGLAERGHDVCVVTNAHEVEPDFRVRFGPDDAAMLAPSFPRTGGTVRLFQAEPAGTRMGHIPYANPYVSKLAGLATNVIRAHDCEIVVGSYLEPYGVAASMAAGWTDRPFLLQHAGSDLDRLMDVAELSTTYREILRACAGVITRPALFERFGSMGVDRDRLLVGPPYELPAPFSPDTEPLTAADIIGLAEANGVGSNPGVFRPQAPTLGMYGKPGLFKGSFDFISALGRLRADSADFNLVMMCGPSRLAQLRDAIDDAGLSDRAWLLPFLAHWRVPSFIRACTAAAFLERDFPVAIHGPVVPREILACGTCLVLSGEIHRKQSYRDRLRDGRDFLLVEDPRQHGDLAERFGRVVADPDGARRIGRNGADAFDHSGAAGRYIDAWEELLDRGLGGPHGGSGRRTPPPSDHAVNGPQGESEAWRRTIDLVCAGDRVTAARVTLAAERYLRARARAMARQEPPQPIVNGASSPRTQAISALAPTRAMTLDVEQFTCDLTPLFCRSARKFDPIGQDVTICFGKRANHAPVELRANEATLMLLEACAGERATPEVLAQVAAVLGMGGDDRSTIAEALIDLYRLGAIRFAAPGTQPRPLHRGSASAAAGDVNGERSERPRSGFSERSGKQHCNVGGGDLRASNT